MRPLHANVSYQVAEQFPDVFREEAPNFVRFVEDFYRWAESEGGPRYDARRLPTYRDVDTTPDELLAHWVRKYMHGLPVDLVTDLRFLQKHVLDVYRSKGSIEGLKLLFRLAYGEDPQVYVPSRDVLKASDGTWYRPRYLEISYDDDNPNFYLKRVTGVTSGATALVEDYARRVVRDREVHLLYLSNEQGDFAVGEAVVYDGLNPLEAPVILGSAGTVQVLSSDLNNSLGQRFTANTGSGRGDGLDVRVTEMFSRLSVPVIEFTLVHGGNGYSLGASIEILKASLLTEDGAHLAAEDGSLLDFGTGPGEGALFEISQLADTFPYEYSFTPILPYEDDLLTANTFLDDKILITEDVAPSALMTEDSNFLVVTGDDLGVVNDDLLVLDWEETVEYQLGRIAALRTINAGLNYVENLSIWVHEPIIENDQISDGQGGILGDNAIVTGRPVAGANVVSEVRVVDSGFAYSEGDIVTLHYSEDDWITTQALEPLITEDGLSLTWGRDDSVLITGVVGLSAVGFGQGEWTTTRGFLSSDKYLQDSYYYQEYSYDVRSRMSPDRYEDVVRSAYHPVGVELFGTTVFGSVEELGVSGELQSSVLPVTEPT